MRFKKLTRLFNRLRYRSRIHVGEGSAWTVDKGATVRDCVVRLNGNSEIRIGAGAVVTEVIFQVDSASRVRVEAGARLDELTICVWNHSELVIGKDGQLRGTDFSVDRGKVILAENNHFGTGPGLVRLNVSVQDGSLEIGDHNRIMGSFWVRFGGEVVVGRYNCINERTEIRADESVRIGSYNMISYCCDIWDTNTHSAYTLDDKKAMFEKDFPGIGRERKRPATAPVQIGDGNWIGKYACVLKGVTLKDNVTVGTRAIVSKVVVEDGQVVVSPKGQVL